MYCPIYNNPFNVSTIEEHADLCLDNKNKTTRKWWGKISKYDWLKNRIERAFRGTGACVSYLQAAAKVWNEWRKWTYYQC